MRLRGRESRAILRRKMTRLPTLLVTQRSPRKKSRKKPSRPYAPPEKYEHLHMLPDYLERGLDVVFCGINPGYTSAENGHHYAHSTNHFWLGLYESGLTDVLLSPDEDYTLPDKYNFGLTNLVDRPTAEQSELAADEMRQGVPALMNKLAKYRPRIICFLSKGIWEVFLREAYRLASLSSKETLPSLSPSSQSPPSSQSTPSRRASPLKSRFFDSTTHSRDDGSPEAIDASPTPRKRSKTKVPKHSFNWGMQPFKVMHRQPGSFSSSIDQTWFFVVPSPSARVVAYQWWDKVEFFKKLREFTSEVKNGRVDASEHHVLPLTTTKSIYFMNM
ncbi:uncharacterized protein PHACADRAFT_203182 [Phanerochaete carnosa HHB-10118-sp]|uniref:Uracil-DNA glycosylase-like domain-containing protein n=1 Tax=Phanerochaete carnosa (strain HHB-10118-sp) TaxID=650164 RepID=K5VN74_PHACS|nr:uncharacterized protein PHACADRAFT_203182 [Phanerochaete carnosa HHB-10118-sp]EKM48145.1 hypothetical protein PHACADRAFT_203182 [Phanerochaete carnosa HHB-10118-sp]